MDVYLTISEAAKFAQVSENVLNELVHSGKIKKVMLSNGAILVRKNDLTPRVRIEERPEYSQFAHLAGQGISLSEASRQYNVPHQTISRWVARGMIAKIGVDGRAVLIDHAQVATCAKIYHESEGGQGKWIFHKGSTYSKKTD